MKISGQESAPAINPLCQGDRIVKIDHYGQNTNEGNKNQS